MDFKSISWFAQTNYRETTIRCGGILAVFNIQNELSLYFNSSSSSGWQESLSIQIYFIYSIVSFRIYIILFYVINRYSDYKKSLNIVDRVRINRINNRDSLIIPNEDNPNNFGNPDNPNRLPLIDDNIQANQNRLDDVRRRMIALELLDSFIYSNHSEELIDFNMLRRMTPEEIRDMVPVEWAIWIDPLNQDPNEQLIYLPCNQNHVFHELCIITWLDENQVCPLWREVVTREAVEGYSRNL